MRCRGPLIFTSVVAAAGFSLLAAGCGGGGPPRVASVASSTTTATTTTQNGTTTVPIGSLAGARAFARCMRAHGIPTPDPEPNGTFDKHKVRQQLGGISLSRVRAVEDRSCRYDFVNGPPQGQTITPADRADYLRAVACMRRHGFPDLPDPQFHDNTVRIDIPSSIDQDSSRFKSAAATCVRLIPAGLPYSRPSGS